MERLRKLCKGHKADQWRSQCRFIWLQTPCLFPKYCAFTKNISFPCSKAIIVIYIYTYVLLKSMHKLQTKVYIYSAYFLDI